MCAIFGIAGHNEASNLTYLGLHALQHRGQEGAGIVSTDGKTQDVYRKKGLVSDIFTPHALEHLRGHTAIGHTRYSTTGANTIENLGPALLRTSLGWIGIAHNGNLTNAAELAKVLEAEGSIFQSTTDTEVIIHLMARSGRKDLPGALAAALKKVEGAFSLLVLSEEYLIAARDPYGFRPLELGYLEGKPVFASETTAFDLMGARYEREVEPGEMLIISLKNNFSMQSIRPFALKEKRRCIFEYIYFARPDSNLFGENVYEMRKAFGRQLALEQPPLDAEVVVPIPDSGVYAAIGYAEAAKLPFEMGIIRSHYIGRTFIEPKQSIRDFGVKLKLNPVGSAVKGKSVLVVDDSLVRGTTSRKLIQHLRDAGAKKVHLRISAPPTTHSCFYGIDTPNRKELMASSHSVEQIKEYIGADSLGYLSLEGVVKVATERAGAGYCHACFSGEYPTPVSHP
jgi:amidophosphoribosyltransferase